MVASRVLPMLGLAILLLAGGVATSEAFEQSGESRSIDEVFTPNAGVIVLDHSNLDNVSYFEQVRVISNVSGPAGDEILAVEGTDYHWNSNNGTIEVVAGSRLDSGADANISYGYYVQSSFDQDMADVAAVLFEIAPLLVFVGIIGGITIALRGLGR